MECSFSISDAVRRITDDSSFDSATDFLLTSMVCERFITSSFDEEERERIVSPQTGGWRRRRDQRGSFNCTGEEQHAFAYGVYVVSECDSLLTRCVLCWRRATNEWGSCSCWKKRTREERESVCMRYVSVERLVYRVKREGMAGERVDGDWLLSPASGHKHRSSSRRRLLLPIDRFTRLSSIHEQQVPDLE